MSESSMRKAGKGFGRAHKERHQPAARSGRGLLEKKKDYLVRARHWHSKQSRLKTLAEKAALKNPDEFYTRMEHARVKDGKLDELALEQREARYTPQQLRAMKAQDESYVAYKLSIEQRRRERLEASLHLLQEATTATTTTKPKHTIFVDDSEEAEHFDAAEYFDTNSELLGRAYNRPRRAQLEEEGALSVNPADARTAKRHARERSATYKELTQRVQREHAMTEALSTLHVQRQLMTKAGGGARKKANAQQKQGKRPVYRFQKERLK